ncbi:ABC transporter permease [Lachnospiraceae bacterium ASD3451]|uniref:ABC transporter permease n=1 Tax=Diplocloster agilis TaxID=2850323 RepID=UPI001DF83A39|nr:ABC transporter permease [Diplocloster agilis]MBU9744886.1 ABC transporter permease [Diplocloster agilis]
MNQTIEKIRIHSKKLVAQILLLIIIIIFSVMQPQTFLTSDNLLAIVRQVATTGIVALGVSFLMLTGNLDFSVGKIYAFSGVSCALMYQAGIPIVLCMILSVLFSVLLCMLTGIISMKFNIPMLIVSIAMMQVIDGLNLVLTDGATIYGLPEWIKIFGQGYVMGVPIAAIIFIICAVIVAFLLNRTYMGRYFFAVGGSNAAARLSGIHVNKVKLIASALCGLLTGIAGIIMMSRSFSGSPYSGANLSNDVISAAVLGGVSIMGGTGKTSGVVTGVLIIGVLSTGLVMVGLSSNFQNMIKGAVLILAVIMDVRSKVVKVRIPVDEEGQGDD